MLKRSKTLLAALLALAMLLTACGETAASPGSQNGPTPAEPLTVTAALPESQNTLDPAKATAAGSETVLYHLYENLMRWDDDGSGFAKLAPGQAESYTVETDYAGNATYTFTLRQGLTWSDGKPVTAQNFVDAWRRLADPTNDLPHREIMAVVAGYDQPVPEDWEGEGLPPWNPDLLAVSAPNAQTFVVTLVGSSAYFLSEVAAGAYTMPVRMDLIEKNTWSGGKITNGAYTADGQNDLTLTKSETYYDAAQVTVPVLEFVTTAGSERDYAQFLDGTLNFMEALPQEALQPLAESGSWMPEPTSITYGVLLNTQLTPFDDANVRLAFRLAIDNQSVVAALKDLTARPAVGLIPYGVADYGEHPERSAATASSEEAVLPEANAVPQPEPAATVWDFRSHSLEKVTVPAETDYVSDCQQARDLLAKAGYPAGVGFPTVEYIYVESPENRAVAETMQAMWKEQLGVTVTIRGLSQEEYDATLLPTVNEEGKDSEDPQPLTGSFHLAGQNFAAPYSDAAAMLHFWHSSCPDNYSGYGSDAFDILLDSAEAAVSFEARDAYLHDAEAILLSESPMIPVYYRGGSYLLSDTLTGLYRGPDGVYFLSRVTPAQPNT